MKRLAQCLSLMMAGFWWDPAGVINSCNKQARLGCSNSKSPDESYRAVFLNHFKQVPVNKKRPIRNGLKTSASPTSVLNLVQDRLPFPFFNFSAEHRFRRSLLFCDKQSHNRCHFVLFKLIKAGSCAPSQRHAFCHVKRETDAHVVCHSLVTVSLPQRTESRRSNTQ